MLDFPQKNTQKKQPANKLVVVAYRLQTIYL